MNQPNLFSPVPEEEQSACVAKSSNRRSQNRRKQTVTLIGLGSGLLILALFYFLANRSLHEEVHRSDVMNAVKPGAIQVEVLNAAGGSRIAQRFTDYLRSKGYDVVDVGNAKVRDAERTYIIDRSGNMEAAKALAILLGLPEGRVVRQIDKNLYLDASVIIGRDHSSLTRIP